MTATTSQGRIYRCCGCRDKDNKQLGPRCPKLKADAEHGSWGFAVDLPHPVKKRDTHRRTGFASPAAAQAGLEILLDGEHTGVYEELRLTVEQYLLQWLAVREDALQPATYAHYEADVYQDLIPAFGQMRLADLRARHIESWIAGQRAARRGRTAIYRTSATLRTALNAAVRTRRIAYNPAEYTLPPRPRAAERLCWSYEQAAAFLRHNKQAYADQLADLFEVVIGTGLRRGEVLGLHWSDVHLMERTFFVRYSLSAVNNSTYHLGPPKTRASMNWVAMSPRVHPALLRQAQIQQALLPEGAPLEGLVFCHVDGSPLRPQWVLDQLRRRTEEIGLPKIGMHDLRHTAATIMISEGMPIALVSKTLRHSTLATTLNLYGHLLKYAAHDTVAALASALDRADAQHIPDRPAPALRFAA